MNTQRAPSKSTCLVLAQLQGGGQYGYALMKATGLKSGSLYPILMRLKERGYLSAKWEASEIAGRPQRQIYTLTQKGQGYAAQVLRAPSLAARLVPKGATS